MLVLTKGLIDIIYYLQLMAGLMQAVQMSRQV